jgi:probable FeS assembly SUF system protein SufT
VSIPTEQVSLARDCAATTVPYGEPTVLPAGTEVRVMQALGGSITVGSGYGQLFRIDGADADAVDMDPIVLDHAIPDGPFAMQHVEDALRSVYDPEMSLNVVELGLIYRCEEVPQPDGTRLISIDMTMTAPGCGMGDVLRTDALRAVRAVPGVDDVEVFIVFDPPWSVYRMPMEVRLQLGLL